MTRVLLAKMGLDCHDTAVVALARVLRDAGMEVIYLGLHNSADKIAAAAEQEDVDVIGLSILSGAHMAVFPKIMDLLRQNGMDDVLVVAGGIFPDEDVPRIKAMGIAGVFGPGTPLSETVEFIRAHVGRRDAA